jgi:hypothetical protein
VTERSVEEEREARRTHLINTNLLWTFEFGQANYEAADRAAAELVASNAPLWVFQGLVQQVLNAFFRGDVLQAARLVAEAESHYVEGMDQDLHSSPTYAPSALRGIAMLVKYWLGDVEGAAADCDQMMAICRSLPAHGGEGLPDPLRTVYRDFLLAGSHSFKALLLTLQQDYRGAVREADAEHAIVTSHSENANAETMFATYDAMARAYKEFAEWVLSGRTEPAACAARYEARVQAFAVTMKSGVSYFYLPLAEMHLANHDRPAALAAAQRGLDHAERHGELLFYPDLRAAHAQAGFLEDPERSRVGFAEALSFAERQGSVPVRLRVATRWLETDDGSGRRPFSEVFSACRGKVSQREFDAAQELARRNVVVG